METFKIIGGGRCYAYIDADNERQALCKFLMEHEELENMMLCKSAYYETWKLARYDDLEKCFIARKVRKM